MPAGICRQQPYKRSWLRCRGSPPRSIIQTAIVLLRLGWLRSQGSSGVEQWPVAGSCADNWRWGNGVGEWRQGRWWLLSSPRLAGPITDRLNVTELTLLSYSEGKRKSQWHRLQHKLYEIKKFCSFLATPNAISIVLLGFSCRGSVASRAAIIFMLVPRIISEVFTLF